MLTCSICGEFYPYSNDRFDCCTDCWRYNLAASELGVPSEPAPPLPLTPRQVAHLTCRAIRARWGLEEEGGP